MTINFIYRPTFDKLKVEVLIAALSAYSPSDKMDSITRRQLLNEFNSKLLKYEIDIEGIGESELVRARISPISANRTADVTTRVVRSNADKLLSTKDGNFHLIPHDVEVYMIYKSVENQNESFAALTQEQQDGIIKRVSKEIPVAQMSAEMKESINRVMMKELSI